tara:strand:- start:13 stop:225 length:213 start_codon:yes stop_codon:yes gene_type:complete
MNRVQRRYRILESNTVKELQEKVNDLIQKEYKDTEGFIFRASGRWQCLGSAFIKEKSWFQTMIFVQEENE